MIRNRGPFPGPTFVKQLAGNVFPPMIYACSGELTASVTGMPLGPTMTSGQVSAVFLSVGGSGKDDDDALSIAGDVYINGVSCISTSPEIVHVSGESSQQKTTVKVGDTGITQSIIDQDANSFSQGDVISVDLALTRTTPETEISNACVVVEFYPAK